MREWLRRLLEFLIPREAPPPADPLQIFETALIETRQKLLDLRATASPLYQARDRLLAEEHSLTQRVETTGAGAVSLLKEGREKEALAAATEQGRLEGDLDRVRRELNDLRAPLSQVEERLRRLESEIRSLEAERDRSATFLQSADARIAVDRILGDGHDGEESRALVEAREKVQARLDEARMLEALSASSRTGELAALEGELARDEARARLDALLVRTQLPPATGRSPGDEDPS